jgi:pSer/pThr/pTyr-binding forkhead associated (FHA) protein
MVAVVDAAMTDTTGTRLLLRKVSDGKTVALSGEVLVGREPPAAVLLTERLASRRHARLVVSAEGVTVEDLGSTNGTYVNGQRIVGKVPLKHSDRLRFDTEEYQLLVERPVDADKTMMRPATPAEPAAPVKAPDAPAARPRTPPEKVVEVPPAPAQRSPLDWINPDKKDKTEFIDPKSLKGIPGSVPLPNPVESADAAYLIVCSGASNGMQIRLAHGTEGQQEWTVGSDPGCDIKLSDRGVSALHARIVNEGARWKVVDEMSANGTYVNEKRSPVSYLASGNRLRFGPVSCLLQLPRSRASTRREPAGEKPSVRRTTIVVAVSFLLTAVALLVLYRLLS